MILYSSSLLKEREAKWRALLQLNDTLLVIRKAPVSSVEVIYSFFFLFKLLFLLLVYELIELCVYQHAFLEPYAVAFKDLYFHV